MTLQQDFNCPQFVDFTSKDAFNIDDGADFCFEKGVVGEQDLDDMFQTNSATTNLNDSGEMERLLNVLKNSTNLNIELTKNTIMTSTSTSTKEGKTMTTIVEQQQQQYHKSTTSSPKVPTAIMASVATAKNNHESLLTNVDKENKTPDLTNVIAPSSCVDSAVSSAIEAAMSGLAIINGSSSGSAATSSSSAAHQSAKLKQHQPPMKQSTPSQGIVKKTIAKVTAVFKQTKTPPISGLPLLNINNDNNHHSSLRDKLNNKKKQQQTGSTYVRAEGPIKVQYVAQKQQQQVETTTTAMTNESNRRCSSVPRTLKERQEAVATASALPTATLGEKIQKIFSTDSSSASSSGTATTAVAKNRRPNAPPPVMTSSKLPLRASNPPSSNTSLNSSKLNGNKSNQPQSQVGVDRRRSRSCNESIRINQQQQQRLSRKPSNAATNSNANTSRLNSSKLAIGQSPSVGAGTSKPRQGSSDRSTPSMPLYAGVKFIPKSSSNSNKYQPSSNHRLVDDVLKTKPLFLQQKKEPIQSTTTTTSGAATASAISNNLSLLSRSTQIGKSASFKHNQSSGPIKAIAKPATSAAATSNYLLNGTVTIDNNESCSSSSVTTVAASTSFMRCRKKSENSSLSGGFLLNTELRAQKRQEFETHMREKDRLMANLKRDMELEKMRKQQEEIQKIRAQRTIRSRPIKHYKPIEIKPSERPLTEPRSPAAGLSSSTSTSSRSNLHSTFRTSASNLHQAKSSAAAAVSASASNNSTISATANALIDASMQHVVIIKSSNSNLGELINNSSSYHHHHHHHH